MKFSHIVYSIVSSKTARYSASEFHHHIKTGIYFILYIISYQNIKIELKNVFFSEKTTFQNYKDFYRFFSILRTL